MKLSKKVMLAGAAAALSVGVVAAVILGIPQAGAPQKKFEATDITGVPWGGSLELADHNGRRRTLADFRGKVIMLFFGFTNCPDVCPLALAEMAQVVTQLGPDGGRVQGLFVTVDPERDTQEKLASHVSAFHTSFLGLRGSLEETRQAAATFKVFFRVGSLEGDSHSDHGADRGTYMVDHSTGIFILDTEGRPRLYMGAANRSVGSMVRDVRRLLARPVLAREKSGAS
jgi:protein SCO1